MLPICVSKFILKKLSTNKNPNKDNYDNSCTYLTMHAPLRPSLIINTSY